MTDNRTPPEARFYQQSGLRPYFLCGEKPHAFLHGGRYQICEASLDQRPPLKLDLIVELGCGSGANLLWLQRQYAFANSIGIDLGFTETISEGAAMFKSGNLNQRWDLDDQSVDVLCGMMVIEHLFDPIFAFSEISRVLDPGGRAFVNLPLITGVKNRFRLLVGRIPVTSVPYRRWISEGHWDGFHLHYFTLPSIVDLATHSGLKISRVEGVGKAKWLKGIFPSFLCGELSFELVKLH
jgi:SAM-dependent methyltransferase